MDPIVPTQGGSLEAFYGHADSLAQHFGVDPVLAQNLATEAVATKVAYVSMFSEYDRLTQERQEAAVAPTPGQHKLAEFAQVESGPLVGIYRATIARQNELGGGA